MPAQAASIPKRPWHESQMLRRTGCPLRGHDAAFYLSDQKHPALTPARSPHAIAAVAFAPNPVTIAGKE
jgi:hypothetical protein